MLLVPPHHTRVKDGKVKIPLHSWVNKATTFYSMVNKKFCERKSISKIRRIKEEGNVDFSVVGKTVCGGGK